MDNSRNMDHKMLFSKVESLGISKLAMVQSELLVVKL